MVFLFPGIISRKSFFSGGFKNRYENGSVIDKFVWNILVSVISLFLFSLLYNLFVFAYNFIENQYSVFDFSLNKIKMDYQDLYNIFEALSKNEMPVELKDYTFFINSFGHLLLLYGFCFFLGKWGHEKVKRYKLERKLSFLQFSNHWEYLSVPNSYNFPNIMPQNEYITWVDVLIGEKEKSELFRGRLEKIVYDKENKIEHIFLNETIQFKTIIFDSPDGYDSHDEKSILVNNKIIEVNSIHNIDKTKVIFKKIIEGDIFVIPTNNIKNLNFTFIGKDNVKVLVTTEPNSSSRTTTLEWSFVISLVFCITSIYYSYYDVSLDFLKDYILFTIVRNILVGMYLILEGCFIIITIKSLFSKKEDASEKIIALETLIVFSIPLLTVFFEVDLVYSLTIAAAVLFLADLVGWVMKKIMKSPVSINLVTLIFTVIFLYKIIKYIL